MKKTGEERTGLHKSKKRLKRGMNSGIKTGHSEPGAGELNIAEQITIPTPKRVSPAADEEME